MLNILRYKQLFYLLIAFTLFNLFFINKAFHIDDPFTINVAQSINKDFFRPIGFFSNPVLLGYYYAPVIRWLGENEVWLHLFYLPFSWLAITAMFFLSLRFTSNGFLPTIFLVVSPAFLISSQSIMLDIPLVAFFLSALVTYIYGIDKNDSRLLLLSGILAGVACLVKYSGFMLVPIMFIYAALFARKQSYIFLLIPILFFLLWCTHNRIIYGDVPFLDALFVRMRGLAFDIALTRIFACLSFITGTSIISLFLMPFLLRCKNNIILFLISLPVGLCPFLIKNTFNEYAFSEKSFLGILFISSFFLILIITKVGAYSFLKKRDKEQLFLFLWFILLLLFTIFIQYISARFILLFLPPMFLTIYRELTQYKIDLKATFRKVMAPSVAITIIISTILAIGDYQFAGLYRDFISFAQKRLPLNRRVYFCENSYSYYLAWGYAYYLAKSFPKDDNTIEDIRKVAEPIYISPARRVLPIIIENTCGMNRVINLGFDKTLIQRVRYNSNVFLHNREYRTGFYSHDWGLLPFKITLQKHILEEFSIYTSAPK